LRNFLERSQLSIPPKEPPPEEGGRPPNSNVELKDGDDVVEMDLEGCLEELFGFDVIGFDEVGLVLGFREGEMFVRE